MVLPFPSPVDHILSKHYHGPMAYSFVELDKAVIHSLLQDQFGEFSVIVVSIRCAL